MERFKMQRFNIFIIIIFCVIFPVLILHAQEDKIIPSRIVKPCYFGKTSPLKSLPLIKPQVFPDDSTSGEIENTDLLIGENFPGMNPGQDPVLQENYYGNNRGEIVQNFEGLSNLQYKIPPDTEGDVGKNHYIQMINMSFAIFGKTGNIVFGPASNLSLWQEAPEIWASYSNGDPIVLYDELADRWLMSELSFPNHPLGPYYLKLAISETNDPLGSWYLYGYEYEYFCDYPKLSVWHDGYYLTTNNNFWINSQWDFHAVGVSVFERDSLLAGSPNARRIFYDFFPNQQAWSMLPADFDGMPPPQQTPAYLAYLKEGATDRIFIYQVETDWQHINNSAVSYLSTLLPESFDDNLAAGISQPENAPYLAPMTNRLMYRLQYRHFDDFDCLVANHTVNRGDDVAGIRWYEFINYGSGWEINQQGTYSPDHVHRWMGSVAMDGYGNIAVGYSVSGVSTYPSVRAAGRTADALPGQFDVTELSIIEGSGVQTNPNHRWGDYSAMQIDPKDQTTFWYTQQYYETTGDRSWQTRIAAFHINDYLELNLSTAFDTICFGDEIQLFATATGGSGNYLFSWNTVPPGFQSDEQNPLVSPTTNTIYFCVVSDGVNEKSDSLGVYVNPAPNISAGSDTIICLNQSYFIADAVAENFVSLGWETSGDGTFDHPEILSPIYSPGSDDISNGIVSLTLIAQALSGCGEQTDTMELIIDPCTGLSPLTSTKPSIIIFPNPVGEFLNIRFDEKPEADQVLYIYSLTRKLVGVYKLICGNKKTISLDVSEYRNGVYLLQIQNNSGTISKRIVIRK